MPTAAQLSENSHQGFDGIKAALCLGSMEAKSNTASGMPVCLWREGTGSRSSGKERDAETGLDYFLARYYSGAQGRFLSADSPSYSNQRNPQSWNLYAYSLNNPTTLNDPSGHEVECADNSAQCEQDAANSTGNSEAAKRVKAKTTTIKHKFLFFSWTSSKTTIQIEGDVNSFKALSQNASRLADLVTNPKTVTVNYDSVFPGGLTYSGTILRGGATSRGESLGFDPQGWIDPTRQPGQRYDTDALQQGLPQANTAEEFGHEILGHIWGEMIAGHQYGTRVNMRDAIRGENGARALDPARGQKGLESHHNYYQMPEDTPKNKR